MNEILIKFIMQYLCHICLESTTENMIKCVTNMQYYVELFHNTKLQHLICNVLLLYIIFVNVRK